MRVFYILYKLQKSENPLPFPTITALHMPNHKKSEGVLREVRKGFVVASKPIQGLGQQTSSFSFYSTIEG